MQIYVFDTNAFSEVFRSYYPSRFPTLWKLFDALLEEGRLTSTYEVGRELKDHRPGALREWARDHAKLFVAPTADEGAFVSQIFAIKHFRQVIEAEKVRKGGKNADPFVIARAAVLRATVVTMETKRRNAARIPNICDHFGIRCRSLEGFMEMEGWQF